jgi:hypothetical protein
MKDCIDILDIIIDQIKRSFLGVFVNTIEKNTIWIELTHKIDFYILIYHMTIYLIWTSIIDSNIIILKIWTRSSLNQKTNSIL